jgi:hypothetical protein
MARSTRNQGFLSGLLTKVNFGWPKGVIRVCRWCFRGDGPGRPMFDQSQHLLTGWLGLIIPVENLGRHKSPPSAAHRYRSYHQSQPGEK